MRAPTAAGSLQYPGVVEGRLSGGCIGITPNCTEILAAWRGGGTGEWVDAQASDWRTGNIVNTLMGLAIVVNLAFYNLQALQRIAEKPCSAQVALG